MRPEVKAALERICPECKMPSWWWCVSDLGGPLTKLHQRRMAPVLDKARRATDGKA